MIGQRLFQRIIPKLSGVLVTVLLTLAATADGTSIKLGHRTITAAGFVAVPVMLQDLSPGFRMGSFDLLFTPDTALVFQSAVMGPVLNNCEWEYFTYRTNPDKTVRIIATADLNNGAHHPSCYAETAGTIAVMNFRVYDRPGGVCEFRTIRWIWTKCDDNTLMSVNSDTLMLSDDVFAFDGFSDSLITRDAPFPTLFGAPDECFPDNRMIDFYNGGVYVILHDTTDPVVTCPGSITRASSPGQCGTTATYAASAVDECFFVTASCQPPSGSFFPVGTTSVACFGVDASGNADTCHFTVTVVDTEPPVVICPADTTAPSDSGQCSASVVFAPILLDNCPGTTVSCTPFSGAFFSVGTTPVTCIARDAAGNKDTGQFTVTVIDAESPTLYLPDSLVVPNDPGACGAQASYTPTATDNCPVVYVSCQPSSGSYFPGGSTIVTCTAIDTRGNTDSGQFPVIVRDTGAPVAVCPGDTVVVNDPGQCGAVVSFTPTATDFCSDATIACSPGPGSFFPVGETAVTCVAQDAAGNVDTCRFTVSVVDIDKPTTQYPPGVMADNAPDQCGAVVPFTPTAIDNCPGATVACIPESESFFPVGSTLITCVTSDAAGNTDTVLFNVIVNDIEPPVVACPEDRIVLNDSGAYGAVVVFAPGVEDNCAGAGTTAVPPSGTLFGIGVTPVTVIGSDPARNADTCTFQVTVLLDDADEDGFPDWDDNCPDDFNPDQADRDEDGRGDVCDWIAGDASGDGQVNVGDAVFLINYIFKFGPAPAPLQAGDANCDGDVNTGDAVFVINLVFHQGPASDCGPR